MPVLVLDSHSRAAVETIQSLGRSGLEVDAAAASLDWPAMHSRYASRKLVQPSHLSPDEFHHWLRVLDRQRNYELIVPSTEASLMSLRLLPETDALRRRAVIPGNHAIDIGVDKAETWKLAKALSVPTPETQLLSAHSDADPPQKFPVVLKPLRSKVIIDGRLENVQAEIIHSEDDYRRCLARLLPHTALVCQEYVVGRGIGAEFLFDHGKKIWHFVHERIHEVPLSGGASSYRRSIPAISTLLADAEKVLTSLEWHGVAMVEFRVDEQQRHWLLEINPRLWGSLALAIDAGVDFPVGLWLVATGRPRPPQPQYRTGYYTRDIQSDVEWFKLRLQTDSPPGGGLSASTFELLRPLAGRESWDHFDWGDLGVTRAVLRRTFREHAGRLVRKLRNRQQHPSDNTGSAPISSEIRPL